MWKSPGKEFSEYETELRRRFPRLRWLFDCIIEAERIIAIDDEDEYHSAVSRFIGQYPQLSDIASYNSALIPVMQSEELSDDMKVALWRAKVGLDCHVRTFHEEISERQSY